MPTPTRSIAEALEDFEREIHLRSLEITPKVKWNVASTSEGDGGHTSVPNFPAFFDRIENYIQAPALPTTQPQ